MSRQQLSAQVSNRVSRGPSQSFVVRLLATVLLATGPSSLAIMAMYVISLHREAVENLATHPSKDRLLWT